MRRLCLTTIVVIGTVSAALAQSSSSSSGTGPAETQSTGVETTERGTLPAAGGEGSAGPGGKIDCQKDPSKCSEPVNKTGASGATPGMPPMSK